MLKKLFETFFYGASFFYKIKLGCFYLILYLRRRIGMSFRFQNPWRFLISFEGHRYEMYLQQLLDVHVFREIFVDQHYQAEQNDLAKYVIDLGSNIGLSVIYFAHKFPQAHIVAVEPHPICIPLLESNVKQFGSRIRIYTKAVCEEDKEITFYLNDEHWSASIIYRRGDKKGVRVPCITLNTILKEQGIDKVDLLKCDIEGAEYSVFSAIDTNRLSRVIGELHPSLTGKSNEDFFRQFPNHEIVKQEHAGSHVHFELNKK